MVRCLTLLLTVAAIVSLGGVATRAEDPLPKSAAPSIGDVPSDEKPAAPALPAPPPTVEDVRGWISGLASDQFAVRESSTKHLENAGEIAIVPLAEAARQGNLEVTCRAIRALAAVADRGEPDTFEKAQNELERLMESKSRSVARRADVALHGLGPARRKHAIARVVALGASIKARPLPTGVMLVDEEEQVAAQQIIIRRSWKGGDEGLVHLRRIPELRSLYVIDGAAVSKEALDALQRDLPQLGPIQHRGEAMLGVAAELLDGANGVRISTVSMGSAAEKAGLREGDTILKYDGKPVTNQEALVSMTRTHRAGDRIVLEIVRDGTPMTVEAVLGEWQ